SAIGWAFEYGAERVTVSVSVLDRAVAPTLVRELRRLDAPERTVVRGPQADEVDGGSSDAATDRGADAVPESIDAPVRILVGLGGKAEFAGAVRELAGDVADG
ncbi:di-trans-poly-cis-decaprenylcistransferase, partial [Halorubrum sp. SS5]